MILEISFCSDQADRGDRLPQYRSSLLLKPDVFKNKFQVHYPCIEIPNKFVVGYKMDYDGLGRNYPDVRTAKTEQTTYLFVFKPDISNKIMLNIGNFWPSGHGKGTQSEKIIEKYGVVHISTQVVQVAYEE